MTVEAAECEAEGNKKQNEDKQETTGDIENLSTLNDKDNEQAAEKASGSAEHEISEGVTKEVKVDDLNGEVQNQANNGKKQTGKFSQDMHVHVEVTLWCITVWFISATAQHISTEKKEEDRPKEETVRITVAQSTTKEPPSKSLERPVTQQSTTSLRGDSRQEKVRLISSASWKLDYSIH